MNQTQQPNRRIMLNSRPHGAPVPENFRLENAEIPKTNAGAILLRTVYLSLDPYMRGRMSDTPSYAPPVAIGDVMVGGAVKSALKRFSDHITRVEVHLSDENSDKKGGNEDMRCVMEARLEGRQPIAVTHHAATLDQAVDGAEKLHRLIESTLGRLHDHRSRRTDPHLPGSTDD